MSHAPLAASGDGFAIGLSGLCLIHCLALPVAAALAPVVGVWVEAEWIHWAFALMAATVSLWAVLRARRRTWPVVGLAAAGVGLLFAGAAGFPTHDMETVMTIAGGLVVAMAHGLNWRARCGGDCDLGPAAAAE